jgi:hypothetical protein
MLTFMSDVTRILSAIEQGDPHAAEQLLPLVYDELRELAAQRLAREKHGQTLQATALVHEAYLRLVGDQHFDNRGHFFAAAAESMRRILVDRAREKAAIKRGGGLSKLNIDDINLGQARSSRRPCRATRPPSLFRRADGRRGRPGDGNLDDHGLPALEFCPGVVVQRITRQSVTSSNSAVVLRKTGPEFRIDLWAEAAAWSNGNA